MAEERLALNEAERRLLDDLLDRARHLVVDGGDEVRDGDLPTLAQLDRWIGPWTAQSIEARVHANDVVNAFGAVLGAHLCRLLGLQWILVSDEHGTDFAVHGDPGDILIFPMDATAKRVERRETDFFETFVDLVGREVRSIRGES